MPDSIEESQVVEDTKIEKSRSRSRSRSVSSRGRSRSRSPSRSRSRSRSRSSSRRSRSPRQKRKRSYSRSRSRSYSRSRSRSPVKRRGHLSNSFTSGRLTDSNLNAEARIYAGNLPFEMSWQDVRDYFEKGLLVANSAGKVVLVDVINYNGRSKGCAVVEFEDKESADRAIRELGDTEIDGRKIFVREDREPDGGRGSSHHNSSRYGERKDYGRSDHRHRSDRRDYKSDRRDYDRPSSHKKRENEVFVSNVCAKCQP